MDSIQINGVRAKDVVGATPSFDALPRLLHLFGDRPVNILITPADKPSAVPFSGSAGVSPASAGVSPASPLPTPHSTTNPIPAPSRPRRAETREEVPAATGNVRVTIGGIRGTFRAACVDTIRTLAEPFSALTIRAAMPSAVTEAAGQSTLSVTMVALKDQGLIEPCGREGKLARPERADNPQRLRQTPRRMKPPIATPVATPLQTTVWHEANTQKEDADIAVLGVNAVSETYWIVTWDGENWGDADTMEVRHITHWTDLPQAPSLHQEEA